MSRQLAQKRSRGFTLIELMIVVTIVGILAVLAVYGVRKYLADAKTAEAKNSLGAIAKDESAAVEKERMAGTVLTQGSSAPISLALCGPSTASVPTAMAAVAGQKYQSNSADWLGSGGADRTNNVGFPCLKFTIDDPQYYMYSYASTSSTYTATANGDLDNNTAQSTFIMTGTLTGGVLNNAPNLQITNEDE